ncbi:MAG: cytochrome C [Pseudomonadota bacterium]
MSKFGYGAAAIVLAVLSLQAGADGSPGKDKAIYGKAASIEQGRYLTRIAGCNDCHTAGYMASAGNVPEAQWLLGDSLGWQGDWGTTYAINLRLYVKDMSEEQWVAMARTKQSRPPMPWFGLREMKDADLRAIYRFLRFLGPAGEPAPAYLPPGQQATGPVARFPSPPPR